MKSKQYEKYRRPRCDECGSDDSIRTYYGRTCRNCGLVHEEKCFSQKLGFKRDSRDRFLFQNAVSGLFDKHGSRTTFKPHQSDNSCKFRRLRKRNRATQGFGYHTLAVEVHRCLGALTYIGFGQHLPLERDIAKEIYLMRKEYMKKNGVISSGLRYDYFTLCYVYKYAVVHCRPFTYVDLMKLLNVPHHKVARRLLLEYCPGRSWLQIVQTAENLIEVHCLKYNQPEWLRDEAVELLRHVQQPKRAVNWKILGLSAIYFAAQLHNYKFSCACRETTHSALLSYRDLF